MWSALYILIIDIGTGAFENCTFAIPVLILSKTLALWMKIIDTNLYGSNVITCTGLYIHLFHFPHEYINGLVQDFSISSALAMEIL